MPDNDDGEIERDAVLLAVDLDLSRDVLFEHEVVDIAETGRQFCLPATLLSRFGKARVVPVEEEVLVGNLIPVWNEYPLGEPQSIFLTLLAEHADDPEHSILQEVWTRLPPSRAGVALIEMRITCWPA